MSYFYGISESGVNTLFSSLNTSKTTGTSSYLSDLTSVLSDYNSIRSGAYGKLLNSYIDKYGSDSLTKVSDTSTSTSGDSAKVIKAVSESADKLQDVASDIVKNTKMYEKVEVEDKEGNKSQQYDMDAMYKAVSAFVESYNDTIDALDESNASGVVQGGINMLKNTGVYEKSLDEIGITIGDDGKLSIDADAFKEADVSTVKTLFSGNQSFAYKTGVYAGKINSSAQAEATKANTYTQTGAYGNNYSTGALFDSIF